MAETVTITVRVTADTKAKLDRLAAMTQRSRSFLAAEALSDYLAEELAIVEGIERGRTEIAAGKGIPHKQAMSQLRARVRNTAARSHKKSA
jgi:predicted transcriptional regulator